MRYRKTISIFLFGLFVLTVAAVALPGTSAMVDGSPAHDASTSVNMIFNRQPELPAVVAATTKSITLKVVSARTEPFWNPDGTTGTGVYDPINNPGGQDPGVVKGDQITEYQFILNVDNAGDPRQPRYAADGVTPSCAPFLDEAETTPNPAWPESCQWPSIQAIRSSSPIMAQGSEQDILWTGRVTDTVTLDLSMLPDGNYLISVVADGYKIDGQWFTLPMPEDPNLPGIGVVEVAMQPYPLPTSTMAFKVFEDNALPNGMADIPAEGINNQDPQESALAGFVGHIGDWAGEVTTDVYGNPLCTEYVAGNGPNGYEWADGAPVPIVGSGGSCLSDAQGNILIPNISTNRWEAWVVPPDGTDWVQTSTLEGNKPWDTWLQEGSTGYDTEFVIANEPFPFTTFGFIRPTNQITETTDIFGNPITGEIRGVVANAEVYVPFNGGLPYQGHMWGGLSGAKIRDVVPDAWIALTGLQLGDTAIYVQKANPDGSFVIPNVPDGDYMITYWDEAQLLILDLLQVSVQNGEVVDLGVIFLTGWFTDVHGFVFVDDNENGKRDPGEAGIFEYPLVLRRRENTELDRGSVAVLTGADGSYEYENMYPYNNWLVLEAYSPNYRVTGYTYQAFNQPQETTVLGDGVDIGVLPIIGQSVRVDWGMKPYEPDTNGGIAGTVFYDSTRAEYDPSVAAVEPWASGIPGLEMNLYAPVACGTTPGAPCSDDGKYELAADGSFARAALLNTLITESWERPTGCQAYDVEGNPVDHWLLPDAADGKECLEPMAMGTQVQNGFTTVDGNYGFAASCLDPAGLAVTDPNGDADSDGTPNKYDADLLLNEDLDQCASLLPDDYLVEVVIPTDPVLGRPLYEVEREETVNVFTGNEYIPQADGAAVVPANPPDFSICAGALHEVDVAGIAPGGIITTTMDGPNAYHNPDFAAEGGSIYEGMDRHLCDTKLVSVINGRSVAPAFTFFTEVPIPGRWWGLILDDLTLSTDPREWTFGEKAGIPNAPIGVYDYSNRLVRTILSDPNGMFEALLPSTTTFNAPSPTGIYANMYRIVGNDPGQPGKLNPDYNPQYRTISANFEVFPGTGVIADLAPTQVAVSIQSPGSQFNHVAQCKLADTTPELFAVDKVYVRQSDLGGDGNEDVITIYGQNFGTSPGTVKVGNFEPGDMISWTDTQIVIELASGHLPGPHQLKIWRGDNSEDLVNSVTIHVIGGLYNPAIFEVGPAPAVLDPQVQYYDPAQINPATGLNYTIQDALNDAAGVSKALVVVHNRMHGLDPANFTPAQEQEFLWNPKGVWYENLVMHSPVKLQGHGPGGVYDDGSYVLGSAVNGLAFSGDNGTAGAWRQLVNGLDRAGNQQIYEGAVISVFPETATQFKGADGLSYASIDGFLIEGGDQQGFPNNINQIGGGNNGQPAQVVVQGGGIFVNSYAKYLRITNNKIQNNGGSYGGAIRIGTPNLPPDDPAKDAQNDHLKILNNQILANGGTNLAGGIGIFEGAQQYEIAYNDLCGNYSAEYGGGISHYGLSPVPPVGGVSSIHHNRIYFNHSMDEGGGIMIAGELPTNPSVTLSPGAGPVDIYGNIIQANLSNDDGGGIRFLMAGNYPYNVYNNIIVNNISTHEGGGVSLNDAPDVRFFNNTVAKNITTATAVTSNGQAAPAGLSTSYNSILLQNSLPPGVSPDGFSDPLLFNNIFWDNRAGTWDGGGISGIGQEGDPNPIDLWDIGVGSNVNRPELLSPTNSMLNSTGGYHPDPSNIIDEDPQFIATYDTTVQAMPWRTNPNFVGVIMVAVDLPGNLMGDYHVWNPEAAGFPYPAQSLAIGYGATGKNGVAAPADDIDREPRPMDDFNLDEFDGIPGPYFDIGADEVQNAENGVAAVQSVIPGAAYELIWSEYYFPLIFQ